MTEFEREKQIGYAADSYGAGNTDQSSGFFWGAKWADENPVLNTIVLKAELASLRKEVVRLYNEINPLWSKDDVDHHTFRAIEKERERVVKILRDHATPKLVIRAVMGKIEYGPEWEMKIARRMTRAIDRAIRPPPGSLSEKYIYDIPPRIERIMAHAKKLRWISD